MSFFSFTGTPAFNAIESKMPYVREGKTKNGDNYKTLNMSVSQAKNNRANTELFGMAKKVIKTFDTERNNIEVKWEDRNDPEVVSSVSNKFIVKIDDERNEFITELDLIDYVCEHKDELSNKKILVTGRVNKNIYNGTISDRFQIKSIYTVDDETKNALKVTMTFFWDKDSIDLADWNNDKKIIINGYTFDFVSKDILGADAGANRYLPQQIILDCSKLDLDNEKHVALMKFKMNQLGIDYVDGKPKVTIKGGKYYKHNIITSYQNGAEEVEFDESTLTDMQKEAIALGLKTIDDFKPSGSIYGNRVTLYKIVDFDLRGEFDSGKIECEDTSSEFEELIFVPAKPESVDDIEAIATSSDDSGSDNDEDLFS